MPERIQLSRKKGWRKPEGAIVVARPSKWGNPFAIGSDIECGDRLGGILIHVSDQTHAVLLHAAWIDGELDVRGRDAPTAEQIRALRGRDLGCWCRLDQPCHADVLLEIANKGDER